MSYSLPYSAQRFRFSLYVRFMTASWTLTILVHSADLTSMAWLASIINHNQHLSWNKWTWDRKSGPIWVLFLALSGLCKLSPCTGYADCNLSGAAWSAPNFDNTQREVISRLCVLINPWPSHVYVPHRRTQINHFLLHCHGESNIQSPPNKALSSRLCQKTCVCPRLAS